MDGSHHDWFEGRRGEAVLMVIVDDATGAIYARFFEEETTKAAMETMLRYIRRQGIPRAVYVDRAGIYRSDREPSGDEVLADQQPETQFGRAMRELEVRLILARSAQAKGRVERCNGTLQDRPVKVCAVAVVEMGDAAGQEADGTFSPREAPIRPAEDGTAPTGAELSHQRARDKVVLSLALPGSRSGYCVPSRNWCAAGIARPGGRGGCR